MGTQAIRRSQFLTTYGPGALLEGRDGPRVILMPAEGFFAPNRIEPGDLEVVEPRLQQVLSGRVFRVPSNAELGREESKALWRTRSFPSWRFCTRDSVLYRGRCPLCGVGAGHHAWRFIMVCDEGHMDDVDWLGAVHQGARQCRGSYLRVRGGGGTLGQTVLECPVCHQARTLGSIYYDTTLRCSGRFPEREASARAPARPGCEANAHVIHRGASNLRMPELRSVLVIPPLDTPLRRLLLRPPILQAVRTVIRLTGRMPDRATLRAALEEAQQVPDAVRNEVLSYDEDELRSSISEILNYTPPSSMMGIIEEEFNALHTAATVGHPATPPAPGMVRHFEVPRSEVVEVEMSRLRFRVAPVTRLSMLMVQVGYRRRDPAMGRLVDTAHIEDGVRWYPAVELQGEGLFIELLTPLDLQGEHTEQWRALQREGGSTIPAHLFRDPEQKVELDPLFVWWHTLAHRIITALGIDSGFSSASIRERVYVSSRVSGTERAGGLLLYTAQPGGDGTHGGLVALAREFRRVLDMALADLDVCSNDPFCRETWVGPNSYSGAACYACLLVSETSCEHRNMWLDRNVLLENMP